jgi:hypothetical protein
MNNYTEKFVEDFYKQNGCELLESYTNARTSVKYRCKCGVISQNNFFYFIKSPYCWECQARKQAHSQEHVETIFKKRGCELLDTYRNNWTRMKFLCRCGEISTITLASFNDKGCYCENCGGKKKLTTEYIQNELAKFNYSLNTAYVNAKIKLQLKCDKGHDCKINWNSFQQGKRCCTCFIEEKWHKPEDRPFVLLCRSLLRNCLKKIRLKKDDKTEVMLGYDKIQLREHLGNYPNWNDIKDGDWHVDHIFPIKAFCDYKIKDTKLINCLENLRPLKGKENLRKAAKYNKKNFEDWLISKGINI